MFFKWRKNRARKAALKRRQSAFAAHPDAAKALVENFPDEIWPAVGACVSGYAAFNSEIDPIRLIETFHCEQARIALPAVLGRGQPLEFRVWQPEDELPKGVLGISTPDETAQTLSPDLVLVPLLAFDDRGYRLGYGGGYYDRSLAGLRANGNVTAVGLAFEDQRVRNLPVQRHDQRLDWIITEKQAYRFA